MGALLLKYVRPTKKEKGHTDIFFNLVKVGYLLYNHGKYSVVTTFFGAKHDLSGYKAAIKYVNQLFNVFGSDFSERGLPENVSGEKLRVGFLGEEVSDDARRIK